MNAYQRGQRDGLLAVAAELDRDATASHEQARWWAEKGDHARAPENCYRASEGHLMQASATANAAALCRRRAESLPDDPEDSTMNEQPTGRAAESAHGD